MTKLSVLDLRKQYHSVNFGDSNSWDTFHLVPLSRPVINPPGVKTNYVDIPGRNGSLDLTDALTGSPVYENRTGSIEFMVMNDYENGQTWADRYRDIVNKLHGQKMTLSLEDDPQTVYEGRITVNAWKSGEKYSTVTIEYNLQPFPISS